MDRSGRAALAALLVVLVLQGATATRPSPGSANEQPSWLEGASQEGDVPYSRRQLLLRDAPQAADAAADSAARATVAEQAAVVSQACGFQLEGLLFDLSGSGLRLAPQEQQEAAVAALVAGIEQLAVDVIRSTSSDVAALRAELGAAMPRSTSSADMSALLHDSTFQELLKDGRDDALLAASQALEPHLPALTQRVHAALAALVQAPHSLDTLPAFSDAFQPPFVHTFTSTVVEATLLHTLWRD